MATSYYSTIFAPSASDVWRVIRDFGNYGVWVKDVDEARIEDGKSGQEVGAIRRVRMGERTIRQRLLAQSDAERFQTYEFCDPAALPVRNYAATLRVTPVIDGNRAFVEWSATFDCAPDECEHWTTFYRDSFGRWLESLRNHLDTRGRD